jgi:hypothetical protein
MRRRTVLAAGALLLLSGACSTENPAHPDTAQLTQAVSSAVTSAKTAKFTTEISVGSVQTKIQGVLRLDNAVAIAASMDFYGDTLEIRLVNNLLYVKAPDAVQDSEKPWLQIARDGTDPFSQATGGNLDQLVGQNDPGRILAQIRAAGGITDSGKTTLDNGETDHYSLDMDLAKLGGDLPAGLSSDAVKQVGGKDVKFPLEMWVDARQLPVQTTLDLTPVLKAAGADANSTAKITTRYTDWGAPAEIQPPPVEEMGELPPA